MAEGRMLKKKISKSRRVNALSSDSARLLYTWLIPHLDIEGRFSADPDVVKGEIFPRLKHFTASIIEKLLYELADKELIVLYQNDGDRYLQLRKFADEQWLRKDKEKASEIAAPGESELISGLAPAQSPPKARTPPDEEKIREEKIREYITLTSDESENLKDRFPNDKLEWMFDKLDYWVSTKKKKVINGYGYFKKGSWLLEEMEKHFNTPQLESGIEHTDEAILEAREDMRNRDMDKARENLSKINKLGARATKSIT